MVPCGFADRVDVILPRHLTLSQPISFGFVVPNITPKIMCARARLKSMTCSEHFSSLEILQEYDQYAL